MLDKKQLEILFARADANDLGAVRHLEDDRVQARALLWIARRLMELEVRQGVDSSTPDPLEENEL